MNLLALSVLFAFLGTAVAPPPTPTPAPPAPAPPAPAPPPPAPPPGSTTATTGTTAATGTTATTPATAATSSGFLPPGQAATGIFSYTSGKPAEATLPLTATYAAGATPPVPGAPSLPTAFTFVQNEWPAQDKVPDTNSPEVQNWMRELEGFFIPEYPPTINGSCALDPAAQAEAPNRGWWTCGGHTRATDITACPDKLTWGVSFDDGPSPYTPALLKYLTEKKLLATFFVVGSRVIERPSLLIEQYMTGHEISVHTWSHRPLTSLTNEQVVAELGWTRKAIKKVLGVTPTTMRPPYGDIDDRVRAISLAMGMQPIIWTRTPVTGQFDTNDWRVAGGLVSGADSFKTFQAILTNATQIDTGFIVLQHDLYDITVELATHFTLDAALNNNPPLSLKPIGQCLKFPTSNLYVESTQNTTFPYRNHSMDVDGDGKADSIIAGAVVSYTPGIGLVSLIGALMLAGLLA